jgi:hypothetical protein
MCGLIAATNLSAGGCRSCSSCHDYAPPVANCQCNACGTSRCGSASCGCASDTGYEVEGAYQPQEGYYETDGELPAPQSLELPQSTDSIEMGQPDGVR